MGMENIEHVVVVMFENRSFDNLLGWLYDNTTDPPKLNIPTQNPPTFDGLKANIYSNTLNGEQVFASHPPTKWPSCPNPNQTPTPDPQEVFDDVTFQIFGTQSPQPADMPNMSGFLQNYATTNVDAQSVKQIMQSYGPKEANVINGLARNFAVCDAWFASVPSQTWPNRGFVHTGSSDGHVNNDNLEWYHIPTIFNVLQDQGKSWAIFYNSGVNSFTYLQFPYIGGLRDNVKQYLKFLDLCKAAPDADSSAKLPAYSFVEPRFMASWFGLDDQPNDYHPPHNICRGEQFLAEVYQAIRNSLYRDKIMLIITFDEHGGCYDHVLPPAGAKPPMPGPVSRDGKFMFDRFGVRVPAIVVSSYVEPGTVFRAGPAEAPYDHASIPATLRDWLNLADDPGKFLPSPRIAAAPTLDRVLVRAKGNENGNWPDIVANCIIDGSDIYSDIPLNDVQRGLVAAAKMNQTTTHPGFVNIQAAQLGTMKDAAGFLHPDAEI
jgi:phospholipase C